MEQKRKKESPAFDVIEAAINGDAESINIKLAYFKLSAIVSSFLKLQ